jgi:hypothetical protein
MLSARDFATLMLVRESANHIAEREQLDPLLEQQLVAFEKLGVRPHATQDGDVLIRNPTRIH